MPLGGNYQRDNRATFTVWAPFARSVSLHIVAPFNALVPLQSSAHGYWHLERQDTPSDTRYLYRLDNNEFPDPASHLQPAGVHGPSSLVDHSLFQWNDPGWRGIHPEEAILYEIHTGTFSPEGTFEGIIKRIPYLRELGITAIELMPVAAFPGERNWGYDGAYPFAVQASYGGPEGLKQLVQKCHSSGIGVIMDVVYNHFGPEGCYVREFGPYFTLRYHTPWGDAVNFDGAGSNEVRRFFIENALHWFDRYHIDALRMDAVHGIIDMSARPFLEELAASVDDYARHSGRNIFLIAESDLNDPRIVRSRDLHGYGLRAQWADDFHHAVHTLLTGEKRGYYRDFGTAGQLAKSLNAAFVYTGQRSIYRDRNFGAPSRDIPGDRFIVYTQNHDQTGNRACGERLSSLTDYEGLKLAAGILLLSPYIPLLFMGEEYGENAPFLYFINHDDAKLVEAVRRGRKEEFKDFSWEGEIPDPAAEETFVKSRLDWNKLTAPLHRNLLTFYQHLIRLRRQNPVLSSPDRDTTTASASDHGRFVVLERGVSPERMVAVFNFNSLPVTPSFILPSARWRRLMDSSAVEWRGPGSLSPEILVPGVSFTLQPRSFAVYGEVEGIT